MSADEDRFAALSANQRKRALRLLTRAEENDEIAARQKAALEERELLRLQREAAKQAEADDLNRRFQALGLNLTWKVQTVQWNEDGPIPSIWASFPTRKSNEDFWRQVLERLEAAAIAT